MVTCKKLTVCLLLLFTCLSLSACATLNAVEQSIFGGKTFKQTVQGMQDNAALNNIAALVNENVRLPQKEETFAAGQEALRMSVAADREYFYDKKTNTPIVGGIPGIGDACNAIGDGFKGACAFFHGVFSDEGGSKATRDARRDTAAAEYKAAQASDPILTQARIDAGLSGLQKDKFSLASIPTPFLMMGIALIIIIIILLLKRSSAKTKAIKNGTYDNSAEIIKAQTEQMEAAAKLQEQQLKMQEKQTQVREVTETKADLINVNVEKQAASAKARCEKWGLNYEELLAQHGGDPVALNQKLLISRPEDFK